MLKTWTKKSNYRLPVHGFCNKTFKASYDQNSNGMPREHLPFTNG